MNDRRHMGGEAGSGCTRGVQKRNSRKPDYAQWYTFDNIGLKSETKLDVPCIAIDAIF